MREVVGFLAGCNVVLAVEVLIMRYLGTWSIAVLALLALLALVSSCGAGNEYRAACQRVWDAGLVTEGALTEEDGRILSKSEYLDKCEREYEEMDPGERAVVLALLEGPFLELAGGLVEAFTEPPCTDLVDTQPVPSQFLDDDGELWGLDCELDGSNIYGFMSNRCEATGQRYYNNDYGWAYKDDKIFHLGDVPENCSPWYVVTTTVAAPTTTSVTPTTAAPTTTAVTDPACAELVEAGRFVAQSVLDALSGQTLVELEAANPGDPFAAVNSLMRTSELGERAQELGCQPEELRVQACEAYVGLANGVRGEAARVFLAPYLEACD